MAKSLNIKFSRGAGIYAATMMGITPQAAYKRIKVGNPDALHWIADYEMKRKKQIQEAYDEVLQTRKYNPMPDNIEKQLNNPEDIW